METNGEMSRLPALYDREDVRGKVSISLGAPKIYEHKGIKIDLVGLIDSR